jgi:hypothetical protein
MFGITAFAQSPFAALGGTVFGVDLADSFTTTDAYDSSVAFSGIYAESFALSDADSGAIFNFFLSVTETSSYEENIAGAANYPAELDDSLSLVESLIQSNC